MIRKQVYLAPEQQRKLRRLAARWHCTESEVLRSAIDRLADPESAILDRLAEAGLLVPSPKEDDLPAPEEMERLEREYEAWVDGLPRPLGLSEAVLEDRR